MKRLTDLVGREMKWTQPSMMKRAFELRDGEDVVAKLTFLRSSLASAETADGTWTFKRVGFWVTRATVRDASEQEIASFRNNTWSSGGTLVFPDGREFRANTNLWNSKYEFRDAHDEPLVKYRKVTGLAHFSSWMEITAAGAALAELPWLATLGWYLAVKMRDDALSGAAAAGAAAAG